MFADFPNEIQCQIIRLLDPIGLISLSQSSRHFRRLINPQKRHLVERLLQVELLNEHGGPTLTFRSRDSKLEPSWQDEAWESMRWACTHCLRLLSSKCFDNQSLLRLGYRKPLPNFDAARMITTWEHRPHWRPQYRLTPGSEEYRLEKSRRELYFFAVTKGVMCDVEGDPAEHLDNIDVTVLDGFESLFEKEFRDMDDEEQLELFDAIAQLIENDDCGRKRYLRNCNECRFRKGFLSYTLFAGDRGSQPFPVVPSRRVSFATELDRHFPGFLSTLKSKNPFARNPSASGYLYPMYMVRCIRCERWQEIRSFRLEGLRNGWRHGISGEAELLGQEYDKGCCNKCLVDTRGRGQLAETLKKWILTLLNKRLSFLSSQLCHHFNSHHYKAVSHLPQVEAGEWRVLLEQTPWFSPGTSLSLLREDLDLINTRRRQWKDLLDRAKESDPENSQYRVLDDLYDKWDRRSDAIESKWKWMMGCREEIEDNPELLVDWALDRDGAAFT
ncbi:hypothetical protein Forpe1208_v009756 [Fusarium oxysporum f. sp. rapae]|uniref:F-box domain-containing protein n=1 Tax=Fusarium oxysporum f. sp. rapae TaxID=485398 RepID=A0A8J5P2B1_FUSOX|nr:hypothetical protein Forpe1208_v009756 [Fusarium oxysporum f. sp. rapae]